MNLANNLERSTQFFSDRIAVREGDRELTYAQLNLKANKVATALIRLGIKTGESIALCAPNTIDWVIFYFGAIKAGIVVVTLDSKISSQELNNLLSHAKPKLIFTTPNRIQDLEVLKEDGILKEIVCSSDCTLTLDDLMGKGTDVFQAIDRERDDTVAILYTGGTTGQPKGVMLTHENIIFSSHAVAYCEGSTPNDVALCLNPFNHVFGQIHIMNSTIYSAGCVELIQNPDLDRILNVTKQGRVTKFFQVPTVYFRLLNVPDIKKKFGKINYCFSAAASMAREIVMQWKEKTGITISESYGMTEAMPVSYNHFYSERHVVGSVGQKICGVEVQIRDISTGEVLKQGEEGEICVRGRNVMKGYLNNPEATKNAFWEGGWLRSGDVGLFDESGFLYIVDRIKDLIITGGENVFPREVEEALYTISEIGECSVIGFPDKEWGERVTAFMVPKSGQDIVPDRIKALLKSKLAPYKVPKSYVVVDDLPKSSVGKILKREIKKKYLSKVQ